MNCPQHGEQKVTREYVVDTRIEDFDAVELACGCNLTPDGTFLYSQEDLDRATGAAPQLDPEAQAQVDEARAWINEGLRQT